MYTHCVQICLEGVRMFPQMKENYNLSYLFPFFFPDNFEAFIVSQKMSRQKLKALIVNIITILGPDENNLV